MVTMTCKCGGTSKTFTKLSKADFPTEWKQDCCDNAELEALRAQEAKRQEEPKFSRKSKKAAKKED